MPAYTLLNLETNEEEEVFVSYEDLQEKLATGNYQQKFRMNIASQVGGLISKTPDSWNEHLRKMRKGSSADNSIRSK